MKIFNAELNLIAFFNILEFDATIKSFLKNDIKTIITYNNSLYHNYDDFENVIIIKNIEDVSKILKDIKNETIIFDFVINNIIFQKIDFRTIKNILLSNNIKIICFAQMFYTMTNNGISNRLSYYFDNIYIYKNYIFKNIKNRYNSNNKSYDMRKYKNIIRRKKIENIFQKN